MTVYVVETGVYEGRMIAGVYGSFEAAKAAYPLPPGAEWESSTFRGPPFWSNGLDDDAYTTITAYELLT